MNRDDPSSTPPTQFDPHAPETTGVRMTPLDEERKATLALSEKHGVPGIDVRVVPLDLTDLDLVPRDVARRYVVLPLLVRDDAIFLATADPSDKRVVEEVEFITGKKVHPYVADAEALRELIDRAYDLRARGETALAPERPSVAPPPFVGTRSVPPPMPGAAQSNAPPRHVRARASTLLHPAPPPAMPSPGAAVNSALSSPGLSLSSGPPTIAPPPGRPPPVPVIAQAAAPATSRRALVVDADDADRAALCAALAIAGFAITEARTARDAMALAAVATPALVVIDPALPDEHGFDLIRRFRANENLVLVPVMVTSAEHRGWRVATDLESVLGVRGVLEKPLDADLVAAKVTAALAPVEPAPSEALPADAEAAMRASNEAWQRGDMAAAVGHLERAVSTAPDSYRLRYHLGLALGRRGELFRAIAEVERSVGLYGKFFPSLKNLAVLYEKAGFRHKALEAWERACAVAPDDPTRDQVKERVLSLL